MTSTEHDDQRALSLAGLPAHLVDWLTQIVQAATGSGRTEGGETDAADSGLGRHEVARACAGDLITAARGVQAWAESVEAEGIRSLLTAVEDDPGIDLGQHESASTRQTRAGLARTAVTTELQLLSGLPLTQCRDRVALASASPSRAGYLRARMTAGTLTAWRALTLLKETRHLDPLTADHVARHVLRPIGYVSTDEPDDDAEVAAALAREPLSQATFRRRLARRLTLVGSAAGEAARRAGDALSQRDTQTTPERDGMACTSITASRERAFAAQRRVTDLARRARAAGDHRTLAQLRSDNATDLLIHGQVAGDTLLGAAPPGQVHVVVHLSSLFPPSTITSAGCAPSHDTAYAHPAQSPLSATAVPPGSAPAAGAGVGEVPGYGFLTAEQVRRIAFAEGSTWRRMITDPMTGAVIDTATTYRPPAAMRRQVHARDHRCRAPGCEHPATESDLDHNIPWDALAREPAHGATHPDNLHALHRGHHTPKTRRWWTSAQDPNGEVHWTTLTGRRITTRPFDHHDPSDVRDASSTMSRIERALASLVEEHDDPWAIGPESAALAATITTPTRPTHVRTTTGPLEATELTFQLLYPPEPITLVPTAPDDPPPF